jgi:UBX domain
VLELQPAAAVSVIDTEMAADVGPSIETEGYLRAREEEAAREAERQRQQQETAMREAAEVCLCTLHACICLFVQHHMYATVHALMVGGGRPQHAKTPAPLTPAEPACALLFPAVWHYKAGFRVCPPPHPPRHTYITHAPYQCALAVLLQAAATQEAAARARAEREAEETARRLALRAAAAERVAPEPPTNAPGGAATLVFRLPDGARISRRFALCQTVTELRDFVDSEVRQSWLLPSEHRELAPVSAHALEHTDAHQTHPPLQLCCREQAGCRQEATSLLHHFQGGCCSIVMPLWSRLAWLQGNRLLCSWSRQQVPMHLVLRRQRVHSNHAMNC